GGVVTGTLSASDIDGDALSFSLNTGPSEGSVVVNADGSYSFDPGSAFQDLGVGESRDVSFSYDVSDGNGDVATENVVITVSGSNDGPVAVSGVNTAVEDGGVVTGTLSASDIDGDTLSYSLNTGPSEGSVVVNTDGSYSFDPGVGFQDLGVGESRDVSFSYDVSDGNGGVATENVVITVSGSNVKQIHGDENDNTLIGTNASEQIFGYGGDDVLQGGSGSDELIGGRGNDLLIGGNNGGDIYRYNLGDGEDVVRNTGLESKVIFGEGIGSDELYFSRSGDSLVVKHRKSSSEIKVNDYTVGEQKEPSIMSLSDGGYIVFWNGDGELGNGLYSQRYGANGNLVGNQSLLKSGTVAELSSTELADGSYVLTWHSYSDGNARGVSSQRFDVTGSPIGEETQVNTYTNENQNNSSITALSDGGYVITWTSYDQDGHAHGVYFQRFDASGNPLGGETQANSYTDNMQYDSSITALSDGGYVITWTSYGQDGHAHGVYFQRFDASGNPLGEETQVNTYTNGNQKDSSITALSDGGYVITWTSYEQDGSGTGVYLQRYDASGNPLGGETQVNTVTNDYQNFPSVIALPDGGYVVTWQCLEGATYYSRELSQFVYGQSEVRLQHFNAQGEAVDGEIQVNDFVSNQSFSLGTYAMKPSVTALSDGSYVVTWASDEQDGDGLGIYTKRFEAVREKILTIENWFLDEESRVSFELPDGTVVTPVIENTAPVAVSGVNTAVEDGGVVTGTLSASDVDGDTLSYSLKTGPSEGSVVVNADGSYSFDPGSAFQDLGVGESRDV
ncbi:hypothetical protein WH95_11025, partial [Kiloniella litopenaei]